MATPKKTVKTVKPQKNQKREVKETKNKKLSLKKVTIHKKGEDYHVHIDGKQTGKQGTENTCKAFKEAIEKSMKAQVEIYKGQNRSLAEAIQFTNEKY